MLTSENWAPSSTRSDDELVEAHDQGEDEDEDDGGDVM